ncbi:MULTISPECIES: putative toxin-antitoxin system toxin component, PIN family [Laspinema]|uniref:Toxin-antitoxin system toxin component, PIN family n=1 Tax=Laspinema olomoucense D3b TaxID=2953688 RepID=A0ABT2NBH9_9CYAN|nr:MULTISPECIES: putative toxin-antitoxin system toxin component, PIN family [unclassified Laspinema]MCT7979846.1 putative toxin-antitoxin system toxin component, PIN family [Laspinema sp. D3b]MCT7986757.1 putative toxin-antitoxin system toxin component, PIN family [Laspinema sp. D2d]MCT7989083.1 putative toxin-antitoxin system toxin component, PIN family [Laspinema sp. D3a]MCT7997183.1 putative toxin-antitoxin system toxin component, PIN family [Laspinema sp. D3c]
MCSKLVIDTNVFVSALISPDGVSRAVLRACLQGKYQPLMGTALFLEYESILARSEVMVRCPLPKADVEALLAALMSVSQWVQIYYLWRPNLRDEADNHLIELAIAGNAEAIVTQNVKDFQQRELIFPQLSILSPEALITE